MLIYVCTSVLQEALSAAIATKQSQNVQPIKTTSKPDPKEKDQTQNQNLDLATALKG